MLKEVGRVGQLLLYQSQLGCGPPYVVAGALIEEESSQVMALAARVGNFVPVDFCPLKPWDWILLRAVVHVSPVRSVSLGQLF